MSVTPRLSAPDRRRQLLETALDLFSRKGFEGTTTKEIAAAAGVTEAIIFRHFPNKQALYTAVIDFPHEASEFDQWMAEWKSHMDRDDDEALINSIIRCVLTKYRQDARVQRMLLFAALEGHQLGLEHNRERSYPIFELLVQYVARRQAEGALRRCNPRAIVAAAAGMADHFGMMTELFGFKPNADDQQVARDFTTIMMHGIGTNSTTQGK
uniref:Transcriptional regulator, TetR family n=1 Tax=Solibacter usitatus (strain Ellin6076) TaxID=234267 RepID=Q025G7_SOLUE